MDLGKRITNKELPELDVTSFMNLMVVLVPMLLLSMSLLSFQTIQIQFDDSIGESVTDKINNHDILSVEKRHNHLQVVLSDGEVIYSQDEEGYKLLNRFLYDLKTQLLEEDKEASVVIRLAEALTYQDTMDLLQAVTVYSALDYTDVVDLSLFPAVTFGNPLDIKG